MTDTPETDAEMKLINTAVGLCEVVRVDFARQLERQRNELAAPLREFGRHDKDCEYLTNDPATHPGCDCGFADALAKL